MKPCVYVLVCLLISGVAFAGEAKSDSYDKAAVDAAMARMLEKQKQREAEKKAATTQPATPEDVDSSIKQAKELQTEIADLREQVPADKLPKARKQLDTAKYNPPYSKADAQELSDELAALRRDKAALKKLLAKEEEAADKADKAAAAEANGAGGQGGAAARAGGNGGGKAGMGRGAGGARGGAAGGGGKGGRGGGKGGGGKGGRGRGG